MAQLTPKFHPGQRVSFYHNYGYRGGIVDNTFYTAGFTYVTVNLDEPYRGTTRLNVEVERLTRVRRFKVGDVVRLKLNHFVYRVSLLVNDFNYDVQDVISGNKMTFAEYALEPMPAGGLPIGTKVKLVRIDEDYEEDREYLNQTGTIESIYENDRTVHYPYYVLFADGERRLFSDIALEVVLPTPKPDTKFHVGDRVKVVHSWGDNEGKVGTITSTDHRCIDGTISPYNYEVSGIGEPFSERELEAAPVEKPTKFKVGDRVRVKHSHYAGADNTGKVSTVTDTNRMNGSTRYPYALEGIDEPFEAWELEAAPAETTTKFKVGDRVRATCPCHKGYVGTVTKVSKDGPFVNYNLDNGVEDYSDALLEAAPSLSDMAGRLFDPIHSLPNLSLNFSIGPDSTRVTAQGIAKRPERYHVTIEGRVSPTNDTTIGPNYFDTRITAQREALSRVERMQRDLNFRASLLRDAIAANDAAKPQPAPKYNVGDKVKTAIGLFTFEIVGRHTALGGGYEYTVRIEGGDGSTEDWPESRISRKVSELPGAKYRVSDRVTVHGNSYTWRVDRVRVEQSGVTYDLYAPGVGLTLGNVAEHTIKQRLY
jgi:hypothetical protein